MNGEKRTSESWRALLGPYAGPELRRSVTQILTSAPPYFLFWYASYRALDVSYWLTLVLALPAAAFLTRLFMIQHDCGHGSFFKSRKVSARAPGSVISRGSSRTRSSSSTPIGARATRTSRWT